MRSLVALLLLASPLAALAQAYPSKPIRMIVPYTAGGAADTVGRAVAPKLAELLGQPVVVENRPGAGGTIGCDVVAKAPADGYTLLSTLGPAHHTIQFFSKNVPYDPVKDFTGVMIVGTAPQVMVVHPGVPANSVAEFIDYAKKNPGKVSFGSSGAGTSQQLGGLLLNLAANIDMLHIPYKGGAAALTDVLGGQIPVAFLVLSNVFPHIKAGKLKALGVLEAKRASAAPGIPTLAEAGMPGYAIPPTWAGILGPANLPAPVVQRLSAELSKAVAAPEVRARLEGAGFEIVGSSSPEFQQVLSSSVAVYQKIVDQAKIRPE